MTTSKFPKFDRSRHVMTLRETARVWRDPRYADPNSPHYSVLYAPLLDPSAAGLLVPDHFDALMIRQSDALLTRIHCALAAAHGHYVTIFHRALDKAIARPRSHQFLTLDDVRAAVRQTGTDANGRNITDRSDADMVANIGLWVFLRVAEAILHDEPIKGYGTWADKWRAAR